MDVLYSRYRDGNIPVHILDSGDYEIHHSNKVITVPSARQLIISLTGHPSARSWTFDRYFRQGIYTPDERKIQPPIPILKLFEPGGIVIDPDTGIITSKKKIDSSITIPESLRSQSELQTSKTGDMVQDYLTNIEKFKNEPKLGIDLDKRGHEVAKLLFSGFRNWIFGSGYDPQDVLQEVYKGLLIRNNGTCPFDVRKASFGFYVHQVCRCVLSNYHRKESRRKSVERIGMKAYKNGVWTDTDVSEAGIDLPAKDPRLLSTIKSDLLSILRTKPTKANRRAMCVVPYLGEGYTQVELSDLLGINRSAVGKAMKTIREIAHREY